VIEDLDGATAEPTRRLHVLILSAAVASIAIALLLGIAGVGLERRDPVAVPATTPAPKPLGPDMWAPSAVLFAPNPATQLRVDLSRTTTCADGTKLAPPYYLVVDAGTQRIFVGPTVTSTESERRAIPASFRLDASTGWMTVTCATDDLAELREAIAR
jgi:hypothetical protein